ncbi:DUF934 domain-containing protein [Oleisolibacter albus]|uniref:DUF934 domain-containing protein n=1 Tax=Oleisolibacter albus TaxID=2171757 RepID=UPI000DF1CBD1|nr:DUF934 domain-containing protein [Oleisolibacter albus]
MPLLKNGTVVEDRFVAVTDDDPLPDGVDVLVPLERWRTLHDALPPGRRYGVRLKSHQLVGEIAPDLGTLALVALELPKFRDGRAFSGARELRERYHWQGEIRAVGHIIPDQYLMLTRVGVDTVEVPAERLTDAWRRALGEFSIAYQAAQDDAPTLSLLRRHLRAGEPS